MVAWSSGTRLHFLRWRKLGCRFKSRRGYLQFSFHRIFTFWLVSIYSHFRLFLASRDFCDNVFLTSFSDGIRMFLNTLTKKIEANENNNFFCSGTINLLFDGLAYNAIGHFAHRSYFSSPRRGSELYYATHKISTRMLNHPIRCMHYISRF